MASESNQKELLRQIQLGLNAFWLMHRFSGQEDSSPSSGIFPTFPTQFLSSTKSKQEVQKKDEKKEENEEMEGMNEEEEDEEPPRLLKCGEEEKVEGETAEAANEGMATSTPPPAVRPPVLDKRWEFVSFVKSFVEFEQLRCLHQVSRNRTFAYGIRYSCTQKTQMRSNCPYLLVCIFADGAGEHSASGVGKITVYSRNKHTHTVKAIKRRQPRSLARQAKREREERGGKQRQNEEATKEKKANEELEEEEGEEEIQILEPDACRTSNSLCQNEQNGRSKDERQNKLMDLLAELSRHFATSTAKEKEGAEGRGSMK